MAQRRADHDLAIVRQGLELLIGLPQLLTLDRGQAFHELHALNGSVALLRWQSVELPQLFLELLLTFRRKLLEIGIGLQCFLLLLGRLVLVLLQPYSGLAVGMILPLIALIGVGMGLLGRRRVR